MRRDRDGRATSRPEGGFTLLEVLVALAILGLAVVTSIELFAGGLRLLKRAGEHQQATLIADRKIREVLTVAEGHETGTDGDFAWERTIREAPIPAEPTTTGAAARKMYAVTVQVRWGDNRSLEVATFRLNPPTAPGLHEDE